MTAVRTAAGLASATVLVIAGRRPVRRAAVRAAIVPTVFGLDDVAEAPGPVVFAANRPSALDGALLRSVLEPVVGPVVVLSGAARSRTAAAGFTTARLALRAGRSVVVFAEAERSDDGSLRPFSHAAARLALTAGVPLVPVGVDGSFAALPPWRVLPRAGRPRVTVTFGRPIPSTRGDEPDSLTRRAEDDVRRAIDGMRHPWFGARLAPAVPPGGDGAEPPEGAARWRRIWESTSGQTRPARRRTWG